MKSFKKQQKQINKLMRRWNEAVENDEAFYGRLFVRQFSCGCAKFADGSGCLWYGVIRVYDKVTNTYKSVLGNFYNMERNLYAEANDFIVNDLQIDIQKSIALGVDYRHITPDLGDFEPFYPHYEKNYSYKNHVL